jgi:hypothetical protein
LNLGLETRIIQRVDVSKQEKEKHKIIEELLGKKKTDIRAKQNIENIFNFIANKPEFTIPQISTNLHMSQVVVWDIVKKMKEKKLVEQSGEKNSSGRGVTIIYALTTKGKAAVAYLVESNEKIIKVINALKDEEKNPILKFCFEAFYLNYQNATMQDVLDTSVETAVSMSNQSQVNNVLLNLMCETTTVSRLLQQEASKQLAIKNAELMARKNIKSVNVYMKMMLECSFLTRLTGQKLEKYVESLGTDFDRIHVPCDDQDCDSVILFKDFMQLTLSNFPLYCGHCPKEKLNP